MSTAHHRPAWLRLVLSAVSLLLGISLLAAPAYAIDDPTIGPPRKDAPLPVSVKIISLTPLAEAPAGTVTAVIDLTNNSERSISKMWVRLQRDGRVTSRAALRNLDRKQPEYSYARGPTTDLEIELEPGETEQVTVSATIKELSISDDGVYPLMINLNGRVGSGAETRVGQASFTYSHYLSSPGALSVAWVWPLIDRPHRSAHADVFIDDDLTKLIDDGGRLDILLSAVEEYGGTAKMLLMVDPELIDELDAMAGGYEVVDAKGKTSPGVGSERAAQFLERLRGVAVHTPIATTAFGDLDTVAVTRSEQAGLINPARKLGTRTVDRILQTTTVSDIDWPVEGLTTVAATAATLDAGVRRLILNGPAYGQDDYLSSPDEVTESAATVLPVMGPASTAVVTDPGLLRIIDEAPKYAAGPVAGLARLSSELVMIASQAPARDRNVVLAPPRRWSPTPEYVDALLQLTTTTPWLTPITFDEVLTSTPQDRGPLVYPPAISNQELPAAQLRQVQVPILQLSSLNSAFTAHDGDVLLGPLRAAVYRSCSTAYRDEPEVVGKLAGQIQDELNTLRNGIYIVPPSNGTYTLASSDAPLVFTVENTLDVPVHYRLSLDESRSVGVVAEDVGVLQIAPHSRATVRIPTTVERSGSFSVVAKISTPDGNQLGDDVRIRVSSSAYGTVALVVTSASFLLLLALIAKRGFTRRRNRAREQASAAAESAGT